MEIKKIGDDVFDGTMIVEKGVYRISIPKSVVRRRKIAEQYERIYEKLKGKKDSQKKNKEKLNHKNTPQVRLDFVFVEP